MSDDPEMPPLTPAIAAEIEACRQWQEANPGRRDVPLSPATLAYALAAVRYLAWWKSLRLADRVESFRVPVEGIDRDGWDYLWNRKPEVQE